MDAPLLDALAGGADIEEEEDISISGLGSGFEDKRSERILVTERPRGGSGMGGSGRRQGL